MKFHQASLSFVLLCALPAVAIGAINIDSFSTATNDRFANDDAFIANDYDLSGIAITDSGRWVTMLSENVFITAMHYTPSAGSSVTFYASNDADGYSVTRTITDNFQQIGDTDLYLGTLDSALDDNFSFYDFATEDITLDRSPDNFIFSEYHNATAFVFGRSETNYSTSQDIAVGMNKLDNFIKNQTVSPSTGDTILSTVNASTDPGYVEYETSLQTGDSGAPLMIDSGTGELTIVGINWFTGELNEEDVNGYSYVGNYDEEIQAFIDANAVPEPTFYSICLGLFATLLPATRRSKYKAKD
jgi:hypothetical protein